MVYGVYSVYDVHVGYSVPLIQENDSVAMRNFENGCADRKSVWYTHSADFYLECIGSFDTITGLLTSEAPRRICSASDFVATLKGDDLFD